mgnify:CR=1 FL=1
MDNLKNITKKQGIIIASVITGLIVLITGFVLITNFGNINNDKVDEKKAFGTLNFEYGAEVKENKFTINKDGKETTVEFKEEIDTMKLGKVEHKVNTRDGAKTVIVNITDTVKPIIEGDDEFEVKFIKDFDVEEFLNKVIKASDPVDGELELTYKNEKINKEGVYKVQASAKDANGNISVKEITLTMVAELTDKTPDKNTDKTPDKNTDKTPDKDTDVVDKDNGSSEPSFGGPADPEPRPEVKPKPETKPNPETKPEPKPEPAPETTRPPVDSGNSNAPSGLPSGSNLIESNDEFKEQEFSYFENLSGGGHISTYVTIGADKSLYFIGEDVNAQHFMIAVNSQDRNTLHYRFSVADLTLDAQSELIDLASEIFDAYGW